jgi:hypothetical protein
MKMKLAALLAVLMLGLAGCTAADNSNATKNSNTGNANATTNKTAMDTTKADENMVKANANASTETGGTNEGCKCSAAGMKCSTKPGEKGCCGAKDGACSTMVDGKSACCAGKGSAGEACCSAAGKMAMDGSKEKMDNTPACGPEKKTETAPAKKS